jgi:hypothetical protein
MEIELDASAVPEALKAVGQEVDGKFKLDLTQLVPAAEVERFKGKAVSAEGEAIERRKALKAWETLGATPDEVRAKLEKGADPAIIEQMRRQHADEVAARDSRFQSVLSKVAMAELKAELSKAGVLPEGLDLLAGYASPRIQFDEEGNVRILGPDGKSPMVGGAANGGATLADLAKQLAASIPQLVRDPGAGGGGKPPGAGGKPTGKTIAASELEAMTPQQKAKFYAANPGVVITP